VECGLGAVAVVHVPVHDRDATQAAHPLGMARADRHVVEKAETHGAVAERVMARRPHSTERVAYGAIKHPVDCGDDRARRELGGSVRRLGADGVLVSRNRRP